MIDSLDLRNPPPIGPTCGVSDGFRSASPSPARLGATYVSLNGALRRAGEDHGQARDATGLRDMQPDWLGGRIIVSALEKSDGSYLDELLRRLPETWAYDLVFRAIFVAWFLFIEYHVIRSLTAYVEAHGATSDPVFIANVLARSAVVLFVGTLMAFVILRSRPISKAPGVLPRLTAFVGSYLMMVLPMFPSSEMSLPVGIFSAVLIFAGNGLSIYVLFWLGRSISIMAEARRLVTSGPYAVIRHPLYVAEELAIFGLFVQYASAWTTVLLAVHIVLQFRRMHYEENVLRRTFSEYEDYARRTPRLIPGVY